MCSRISGSSCAGGCRICGLSVAAGIPAWKAGRQDAAGYGSQDGCRYRTDNWQMRPQAAKRRLLLAKTGQGCYVDE